MELDLENPLTSFEEQQSASIPALFAAESDHMPSYNFCRFFEAEDSNISIRQHAISLILQAQSSYNLDPLISYLAMNYVDRFISKRELPQDKPWMLKLLVISSLSLAAKMKNKESSLSHFQRDEGFIVDPRTIQRMELLILSALDWRMRSITPFSFLHFFLSLFQLHHQHPQPLMQSLKDGAAQIIFKAHHYFKLLEFKPSIIAASALLSAAHDLFPSQFPCFRNTLFSCEYVNEERLVGCFKEMQDMAAMDGDQSMLEAVSTSTKTPASVLDGQHCTNSESETTVMGEIDIKPRKSHFCCDNRLQLSQIQHC